jgi:DNA-binding transcriptional ArsR family regulator
MPAARPRPRRAAAETYWILGRAQIAALASARRQEIVDALAALGPSSARELAAAIGAAPSAVYHHLDRLVRVGLVVESGRRVVRRKSERLFAAAAPRMRLARALDETATRARLRPVVAALARQAERDFAAGVRRRDARTKGAARDLGFFRIVARPTAAQRAALNRHLAAIAELLWSARKGKGAVSLAWILAPVNPVPRGKRR